jgi:hypothetical protein
MYLPCCLGFCSVCSLVIARKVVLLAIGKRWPKREARLFIQDSLIPRFAAISYHAFPLRLCYKPRVEMWETMRQSAIGAIAELGWCAIVW